MQPFPSTGPVVVGIDGSEASLGAAEWAVNEAASRDVALRLVFAAPNATTQGGDDLDLEYGEQALRTASAAIEALGTPIKLETAIRCGPAATVLLEESSSADLICVGSVGIGPVAAAVLGSTAAEVAGQAHCPVAIIRRDPQRPATRSDWIAVAVNASRENELVIETALELARRHQLRVLAVGVWQKDFGETPYDELDRRVAAWQQRYPDVDVHAVATRSTIANYLAGHNEPVRMVVIGAEDTGQIATIIGPHTHPLIAHGDCSVLVARR